MKSFGYTQSNSDHTLFLKNNQGKITALIIYVDDMIVTGNDLDEISSLQESLASEFDMKQLGDLKYFLGIEVARSKHASTDKGRYQRLVGKLIYLSHTRPNIAYAVNVVSQFMHDPRKPHMDAVERILRYLKSAPGKGYLTFVGGNLVTWRSKKQEVVARSSAEAEFRGMAIGICELLWIKNLLKDIGYEQKMK
uniref:Reverse transcriptase Ty1/copia-type domain-containing protein n=1 Tax=Cajanus cajan TaxID=3821 RepID=A0A151R5F0_CAJCA|nr:hypothetical protein KK1_041022 [Cajanus cajan]